MDNNLVIFLRLCELDRFDFKMILVLLLDVVLPALYLSIANSLSLLNTILSLRQTQTSFEHLYFTV